MDRKYFKNQLSVLDIFSKSKVCGFTFMAYAYL